MRALVATLTGVDVVCFLVEDVVDAVDKKVKRQRDPNENWQHAPVPDESGQPHTHDRGTDGVNPQDRS